jgi:hypothetical protein
MWQRIRMLTNFVFPKKIIDGTKENSKIRVSVHEGFLNKTKDGAD